MLDYHKNGTQIKFHFVFRRKQVHMLYDERPLLYFPMLNAHSHVKWLQSKPNNNRRQKIIPWP